VGKDFLESPIRFPLTWICYDNRGGRVCHFQERAMRHGPWILGVVALIMAFAQGWVMAQEAPVKTQLVTWPAPQGVAPAKDWGLKVDGRDVFVYAARVREKKFEPKGAIFSHQLNGPADEAGVGLFDFQGSATVEVKPTIAFKSAVILPTSAGIKHEIKDGVIRFMMDRPRALAVLLDGEDGHVLHLLPDAPEKDAPGPQTPGVVYFGPGLHEVEQVVLRPGQTLYLAGGAVLRIKPPANEQPVKNERTGLYSYKSGAAIKIVLAPGAKVMGRGIVDCQLLEHPARVTIGLWGSPGVVLDGVTLINAASWNVDLRCSDGARVRGVKAVSGRFNSDGINTVSSSNVRVTDCFVRNHDDSFAVKAGVPGRDVSDVVYERCTAWNDWGYGIGVTYETRANIKEVTWRDCDIMTVRHWAIGVYVVDSGTIQDVLFEDIRVEGMGRAQKRFKAWPMLLNFQINSDMWGTDKTRGQIKGVTVKGLKVFGLLGPSGINGVDEAHKVTGVRIEGVEVNGKGVADSKGLKLKEGPFADPVEWVK
jgi:hypothetical protein